MHSRLSHGLRASGLRFRAWGCAAVTSVEGISANKTDPETRGIIPGSPRHPCIEKLGLWEDNLEILGGPF